MIPGRIEEGTRERRSGTYRPLSQLLLVHRQYWMLKQPLLLLLLLLLLLHTTDPTLSWQRMPKEWAVQKNQALASTGWRNSGAVVLKLVLKTPSEIPGTVLNLRSYVVRSIQLVVRAWAWFRLYFDREGRYWYSAANLMNLYICLQQRHF